MRWMMTTRKTSFDLRMDMKGIDEMSYESSGMAEGPVLTQGQEEIVENEASQLLIKGIAGSGKTLVLLKKAKRTAEKYPVEKVGIFTYANTLSRATGLLIERYELENLNMYTFHRWAMSAYRKTFRQSFDLLEARKGDKRLEKLKISILRLEYLNHRFTDGEQYLEFISDEISWIKGKGISTVEEYLEASRKGRGTGTRVTLKDREVIFMIFEEYENQKGMKLDFDDFAIKLLRNFDKIPEECKFDHVFIDEAQDLQQIQLQLLRKCARRSLIVAADKGQKIYKTSFTWKDIGLNITGNRTKILTESHRSTKQIIQLAASLQQKDSVIHDEEYVVPGIPEREGPVPHMLISSDEKHQDARIIESIRELLKNFPMATIGVLYRHSTTGWRLEKELKKEKIAYPQIVKYKNFNPYTPGVKFCTFHSAKGLEFDIVLIADLINPTTVPEGDEESDFWDLERRLLYVCITRAKMYLQLFTHGDTCKILSELDSGLYERK